MNEDDVVAWKNLLKTVTPLYHRPMRLEDPLKNLSPVPTIHNTPIRTTDFVYAPSFEIQKINNTSPSNQIIPPRVKRRLGTKAMPIEATLDLHGLTLDKAYQELEFFIKKRSMYGNKVVLIITGKGRGSPKGHPTIRQQFKDWIDYL
jgi:DNA-nicking Smr family endonuclease